MNKFHTELTRLTQLAFDNEDALLTRFAPGTSLKDLEAVYLSGSLCQITYSNILQPQFAHTKYDQYISTTEYLDWAEEIS